MITYFIQAQDSEYYERMVTMGGKTFPEAIKAGEMMEDVFTQLCETQTQLFERLKEAGILHLMEAKTVNTSRKLASSLHL
ncbi:hypothetical protein H5410_000844, partial [Solanum commersonii]